MINLAANLIGGAAGAAARVAGAGLTAGAMMGNAAYRGYKMLGGHTWQELPMIHIPGVTDHVKIPLLSAGNQFAIGGLAVIGAIAAGARDFQNQNFDVMGRVAEGSLEIERPEFLGATGSLGLTQYYRQRGVRQQYEGPSFRHQLPMIADDIAMLMLRR